jgi:hypothetical protein
VGGIIEANSIFGSEAPTSQPTTIGFLQSGEVATTDVVIIEHPVRYPGAREIVVDSSASSYTSASSGDGDGGVVTFEIHLAGPTALSTLLGSEFLTTGSSVGDGSGDDSSYPGQLKAYARAIASMLDSVPFTDMEPRDVALTAIEPPATGVTTSDGSEAGGVDESLSMGDFLINHEEVTEVAVVPLISDKEYVGYDSDGVPIKQGAEGASNVEGEHLHTDTELGQINAATAGAIIKATVRTGSMAQSQQVYNVLAFDNYELHAPEEGSSVGAQFLVDLAGKLQIESVMMDAAHMGLYNIMKHEGVGLWNIEEGLEPTATKAAADAADADDAGDADVGDTAEEELDQLTLHSLSLLQAMDAGDAATEAVGDADAAVTMPHV